MPLAYPVESYLFVNLAALRPVLVDFHVQEQVHRHPEDRAQLLARLLADGLDPRAALAEDDRLLAVATDDDLLVDLDAAVLALGVALGAHRAVVGQLLVELLVELLAR